MLQDGYNCGVRRNQESSKVHTTLLCDYTFYFYHDLLCSFFYTTTTFYLLQEHTAQYSSGGTICYHDLCSDERVVLNSPVGRRNDFSPGGSGSKYTTAKSILDLINVFFYLK